MLGSGTCCLKAALMPDTWNSFQHVELIAPMVVPDFTNDGASAAELELVFGQRIVQPPLALELLKNQPFSDANL